MYIHGNYFSKNLDRNISYLNIFPDDFQNVHKKIILLNGRGGDQSTWSLNTPLETLANEYHVAFFCPNGENSFYTNHADGENYADTFGKEFLIKMKEIFKLDFTRSNTEIAGYSMGGYGALLLGLRFHQYYSRIGIFSPAFVFYKKNRHELMYNHVFSKGDYNSENDVIYWYNKLYTQNSAIPNLFISCGNKDPLFIQSVDVIKRIQKINADQQIKFVEQNGFHDFSLWSPALNEFLQEESQK